MAGACSSARVGPGSSGPSWWRLRRTRSRFPAPAFGAQLRTLFVQGLQVAARWRTVFEALQQRHPFEPHWYLGLLGADPPLQGRGLGSALLEAWLPTVDGDALPAYLETDREENLRFYGRRRLRGRR